MLKRSRKSLLLAMTLLCAIVSDSKPPAPAPAAEGLAATNPLQATRLRKLHLVRPDLINYPLAFEVVC